jgi:hypothetical protein
MKVFLYAGVPWQGFVTREMESEVVNKSGSRTVFDENVEAALEEMLESFGAWYCTCIWATYGEEKTQVERDADFKNRLRMADYKFPPEFQPLV